MWEGSIRAKESDFLFVNLSIPDLPFPVLINSHQELVSGQACNPPDPH